MERTLDQPRRAVCAWPYAAGADFLATRLADAEEHFRDILAPFGQLTDEQWRHITEHSVRRDADGHWRELYDPGVAEAFRSGLVYSLRLWTHWDAISCPVLVLRGAESDLLSPQLASEMVSRCPSATLIELPGCGHAPSLMDAHQIGLVSEWLATV